MMENKITEASVKVSPSEWACNKHGELVQLVNYKSILVCVVCQFQTFERLRRYNHNLNIALKEERRLRGAAQKVIGRLMTSREQWDATINSLKLELENLRLGK